MMIPDRAHSMFGFNWPVILVNKSLADSEIQSIKWHQNNPNHSQIFHVLFAREHKMKK